MAKLAAFLIVISLLGLIGADSSWAEQDFKVSFPVTTFAGDGFVELRGSQDSYNFSLPLAQRLGVKRAVLRFSYVNSSALLMKRSRLMIHLNQHVIGQVALDPRSPEGEVSVQLPLHLLKPGYNDIRFEVTQAYTENQCQDPSAPELWTHLHLDKSALDLEYGLKTVPLSLAGIKEFLFDEKLVGPNRIHLVLEELSPEHLRLAALAASAVAISFSYQPAWFTVSGEIVPEQDNILIGSPEFAQKILGLGIEKGGGVLGVTSLPLFGASTPIDQRNTTHQDSRYAVVYMCGSSTDELQAAVNGFVVQSFPLPESEAALLRDVRIPRADRADSRLMAAEGRRHTFRQFGFQSRTFSGVFQDGDSLQFRFPTDVQLDTNGAVAMQIHLTYSTGLRRDSALNIYLNDRFAASIPLDSEQGGLYRNYRIDLPLYMMQPGLNTLQFRPSLTPKISGECEYIAHDNLLLTVFDDSRLVFPELDLWTQLPRLDFFFQDGFPYTRHPDWASSAILLSETDYASASSAVNVVALVSQKTGIPPFGLQFLHPTNLPPADFDLLVFGRHEKLPADLWDTSPLGKGIPHPVASPISALKAGSNWIFAAAESILGLEPEWVEQKENKLAVMALAKEPRTEHLLLMQFQSPWRAERTITTLNAENGSALLQGAHHLWDPGVQGRINGTLSLIEKDESGNRIEVRTLPAFESFHVGEKTAQHRIRTILLQSPWRLALGLGGILLLVAAGLYVTIRRRAKARHCHD